VSYLHQQDGERRFDYSVRAPLASTGFAVYGNYQSIKNSTINPDLSNVSLIGLSHGFMGGEAAIESSIINHNANSAAYRAESATVPLQEKRLTGAYSHELKSGDHYNVVGRVELSGRLGNGTMSDAAAATRLNVNFTSSSRTTDLFKGSTLEARIKERNDNLDKGAAAAATRGVTN
jgi:hypothetical protein